MLRCPPEHAGQQRAKLVFLCRCAGGAVPGAAGAGGADRPLHRPPQGGLPHPRGRRGRARPRRGLGRAELPHWPPGQEEHRDVHLVARYILCPGTFRGPVHLVPRLPSVICLRLTLYD